MTPVGAVLLDLDGTLLDYGDAAYAGTVRRVCAALADERPGLDPAELGEAFTAASYAFWGSPEASIGRAPSGAMSGRSVWGEIWADVLARLGEPALATRALDLYAADRRATYRLFDDATEVLPRLRARCDTLVLVTNGAGDTQREKAAVTGIDRYLCGIVVSGEVGVAKPDRAIFAAAVRLAGVAPEAVWHVGDSLPADVGGARGAGLGGAVWVNRTGATRGPGDPAPHHEIATLSELLPLLEISPGAGTDPVAGPARPRGG